MAQLMGWTANETERHASRPLALDRESVRARIAEVGVIPALRGASPAAALFAAESLAAAGIPILEIAATAPGTAEVISELTRHDPKMIVGAGDVNDSAGARRCLDAGAKFLATAALLPEIIELAAKEGVAIISGAFTPTEIVAARNAGSDFVKVFPCDAAGGAQYIRSVRSGLPDVLLVAAGGVTQQTAEEIVASGATALGVGRELIPAEAIRLRQMRRIQELARRFLGYVDSGRIEAAGRGLRTELK